MRILLWYWFGCIMLSIQVSEEYFGTESNLYSFTGQIYQSRALITINNQVPIIKQDSITDEQLEYLKVRGFFGFIFWNLILYFFTGIRFRWRFLLPKSSSLSNLGHGQWRALPSVNYVFEIGIFMSKLKFSMKMSYFVIKSYLTNNPFLSTVCSTWILAIRSTYHQPGSEW